MADLVTVNVEKYKGLECSDKGVVIKCDSGKVHRIPSAKEVQDGLDKKQSKLMPSNDVYITNDNKIIITSLDDWKEYNLDGTPKNG